MKIIRSGTQLQKDLKEALDVLQNIVKETNPEYRGHQAPEASSPKITSTLSRSVTHLSGPGSRYTSPLSTLSSNSSTNDASKGPRKSLSTNSKPETASSSTTVSTGSMELPRSELRPRNPNAMTQSLRYFKFSHLVNHSSGLLIVYFKTNEPIFYETPSTLTCGFPNVNYHH